MEAIKLLHLSRAFGAVRAVEDLTFGIEQGEIFKMALHFSLNNALCLSLCYSGWLLAHTKS